MNALSGSLERLNKDEVSASVLAIESRTTDFALHQVTKNPPVLDFSNKAIAIEGVGDILKKTMNAVVDVIVKIITYIQGMFRSATSTVYKLVTNLKGRTKEASAKLKKNGVRDETDLVPLKSIKGVVKGVKAFGTLEFTKTGDMYVAQQVTVALGVGGTGTAQAGNKGFGAEASGTIGIGATMEALKLCAIIVLDEFVTSECCESDGKRLTDTPLQ